MNGVQLEILQRALRGSRKENPKEQLESVKAVVNTHYGLYKQEKDLEGQRLYKPLVDLLDRVKSVEELERLVVSMANEGVGDL